MRELLIYIQGVVKHCIPLLTGSIAIAVIGTIEHFYGNSISWKLYATIVSFLILVAFYRSWRDEYRRRIFLEERAKPKLKMQYLGSMTRPEYQEENDLYRVAVVNNSDVPVHNAQVILESVESDSPSRFYPGHGLRVMGCQTQSPLFEIAAGSRVWVDIAERISPPPTVPPDKTKYPVITYAKLGYQNLSSGKHVLILRAEGSGSPCRARVTITVTDTVTDTVTERYELSVSDFQPLN